MMKPTTEWPADDPRRTPVTLRGEFLAQGFTDRWLAITVRDGVLARPRRGAYVDGTDWRRLDAIGQHAVRARAVLAQARTSLALSHVSGLIEYDTSLWDVPIDDVHVTRTDRRIGRPEAGVRQHRGLVEPGDVVTRNGVPVMSPARLALESTMTTDVEHGLTIVNDLLHRGLTTIPELGDRYRRGMSYWPNSLSTELVLRLADPRIETIGETRTFHLCFRQKLPLPQPQFEVRDSAGRLLGRLDFAWPEHGVFLEFDGKVKYEKLLRPGQRPSDVVIAEKRREERICRQTGWRCLRLVWSDLARPQATAAVIREALFPPSIAA